MRSAPERPPRCRAAASPASCAAANCVASESGVDERGAPAIGPAAAAAAAAAIDGTPCSCSIESIVPCRESGETSESSSGSIDSISAPTSGLALAGACSPSESASCSSIASVSSCSVSVRSSSGSLSPSTSSESSCPSSREKMSIADGRFVRCFRCTGIVDAQLGAPDCCSSNSRLSRGAGPTRAGAV